MEKTAIKEVLGYAQPRGYIRNVPQIKFKPKAKTENRATFTKEEYEKLIIHLKYWSLLEEKSSDTSQRKIICNLVVFLATSGIRPSEYYKIKWNRLYENF